jgi:O-succinylbenzoate synthase
MALYNIGMSGLDLISYTVYRYRLPYRPPFSQREGLLLHCVHSRGEGWGEIAPLPGRSRETLLEAQQQLLEILSSKQQPSKLHPSVSFGLSSALHVFNETPTIPLAALLAGTAEEILAKAEEAYAQGFRSAKVKISDLSSKKLLPSLAARFALRIDANRAFSFKEAIDLCTQCPMEYIEEPTYEIDKLERFPFPYALDETLLEKHVPANCHAIVYKPTVLGCPMPSYNKRCILSSACETGVGIVHVARLAALLAPGVPCGLDTYRFLEQDVLQTPLDFSSGNLCLPQELHVDTSIMDRIADG